MGTLLLSQTYVPYDLPISDLLIHGIKKRPLKVPTSRPVHYLRLPG